MPYAITNSGSWRAINTIHDLVDGETYSETAPPPELIKTAITPSQQIILADGEDAALITVTGEPGVIVEYTINGEPQSLTLDADGKETIELTCDTPNTTLLVQAGTAKAVIYAVEVPA